MVEQIASSDPACQRFRQIPGIGPLVAIAIVAAIGNGSALHKGREFASWLGLVPRQHSTGGKVRPFDISKRRNRYLRKIPVHGARSDVLRVKRERSPFGAWLDLQCESLFISHIADCDDAQHSLTTGVLRR